MTAFEQKCRKALKRLINAAEDKGNEEELEFALKIIAKLIYNVIIDPQSVKFRLIPLNTTSLERISKHVPRALKLLEIAGFGLIDRNNPRYRLGEHVGATEMDKLYMTLSTLVKMATKSEKRGGLGMDPASLPEKAYQLISSESFDVYKSKTDCFNPTLSRVQDAGGKSKIERQLEELKLNREQLIEESGIPERRMLVFSDISAAKSFDKKAEAKVSVKVSKREDRQIILEASRANIARAAQRNTLSTRAMKEYASLKSLPVFIRSLIRLQFPDGVVIQAFFSPLEKIEDVIEYFGKFLKHDSRELYLFQSPPKRLFDRNSTLEELRLVPSARVYAAFKPGKAEGEIFKRSIREQVEEEEWRNIKDKSDFAYSKEYVKYISVA